MESAYTHQQETALFVGAFLDELCARGVREVVISPGSRSTPLAMCAYELSRRFPQRLRIYVDVDERGASFFALGLAKAAGRPVALVCTSGTAVANYLPAVVEASTSRVPLIILTGDRPLRLQDLGAPQTCDQLKIFGDYVRSFREMPEPRADARHLAFARQTAFEAVLSSMGPGASQPAAVSAAANAGESYEAAASVGGELFSFAARPDQPPCVRESVVASRGCAYLAGPVHLNFPFDEPLKPDLGVKGLFEAGRRPASGALCSRVATALSPAQLAQLEGLMEGRRTLVLAGEGTCETADEAREVIAWAAARKLPLVADPLSGLRSFADACVIDNADNVMRADDAPLPDLVIRFGRWPVSKPVCTRLAAESPVQVVVDAAQTRDFNSATSMFVPMTPLDFVRQVRPADQAPSGEEAGGRAPASGHASAPALAPAQQRFFEEWVARNDAERERILSVARAKDADELEGAYVRALLDIIPEGSLLFSASSMPIRALDTFMVKEGKPLALLCNRGQNGIDGTVSTALGAAQLFERATFLTGDFTMLHDLNALALRRELARYHGPQAGEPERSMVIVLLNNNGGAIFDMLPQASDEDYFERLFLVPQDLRFEHAAAAFGIPFTHVETVEAFKSAYRQALDEPGINLVEVSLPLRGVRERYAPYQV